MQTIHLSSFGNSWTDLKYTDEDGWWIEHGQPMFSCVSKRYESEEAARAAYEADEVVWMDE